MQYIRALIFWDYTLLDEIYSHLEDEIYSHLGGRSVGLRPHKKEGYLLLYLLKRFLLSSKKRV